MKKRLSLLMAALMIITMLPMSAFAAGKPSTVVQTVTPDDKAKKIVVAFGIEATDVVKKMAAGTVQLTLTNGAKFAAWDHDGDGAGEDKNVVIANVMKGANAATQGENNKASFDTVGDTVFVNLKAEDAIAPKAVVTFSFAVNFENAGEGDVNLEVVDNSTLGPDEDSITKQTVKIAVVKEAESAGLSVTAKDAEKIVSFDGGDLSQFEIKNFKKVNEGTATHLYLELDEDFKWDAAKTKVFVDGKDESASAEVHPKADNILIFPNTKTSGKKSIIVQPVVKAFGRNASVGKVDLVARVAKHDAADLSKVEYFETARAIIGQLVDYNVTMTIVEKKKKEIPSMWGGEEAEVTVTLKGPKGSILNRRIEFKADGVNVKYDSVSAVKNVSGKGGAKAGDFYKDAEFDVTPNNDSEEVKFHLTISAAGNKDGVATLTAAQRGWEVKSDLAKVTPKFAIKAEEMPVKKGEARSTSDIVITEAKAGLLQRGESLLLTFNTRRHYTQFSTDSVKVEATNGMKFGDPSFKAISYADTDFPKHVTIELPITRESNGEPAVITVSGIKVLVDGSSTDDMIKVNARLAARGKANGIAVANANYIKVVKEYALESILTVFTIGQTQYTVNGEAKTAASAPYIKNGKTMLPIRALSESLGLTVQWNGQTKTATFTDSTKVAAVTIGAEKMFVNGTPIPLAAKAELVNGTTFVELRSLATAFGVQIDWDAAAKTATVSK